VLRAGLLCISVANANFAWKSFTAKIDFANIWVALSGLILSVAHSGEAKSLERPIMHAIRAAVGRPTLFWQRPSKVHCYQNGSVSSQPNTQFAAGPLDQRFNLWMWNAQFFGNLATGYAAQHF
jgi:hypothetical protein